MDRVLLRLAKETKKTIESRLLKDESSERNAILAGMQYNLKMNKFPEFQQSS
jgi:hypothetical protein